jgi:4-amino-4-deoxy-L-arabinose transferase-like glycosyltransferase
MPVLPYATATAPALRENRLLALIPRWRWAFFALVGLLMVLAFNGQWRVGRDSAAYRGLGHQLATTGKYVFRDKPNLAGYSDQQDTRYPGMPLILAGVEKIFGRSDAAADLTVALMAALTLILTYRLAKGALPLWLAIAVVFGMGANGRFLEHANEVLSDVPFLLGVVLTLLAFDRLMAARNGRARAGAIVALIIGLIFAAAMRPTFWVLALALTGTCAWGIFRPISRNQSSSDARARRVACGVTLLVLAMAAVVFVLAVDLRGRRGTGYEGRLIERFHDFPKLVEQLPENVHAVLEQTLPEGFFGTQLGSGFIPVGPRHWIGLSTIFSLLLIGASVLLVRRNVLWGLFVLLSVLTMATLGSVPRYFIMILPLLLAGWGLLVSGVARRFDAAGLKEFIAFVGLGMVVAPNLIMCGNLIREQRGFARPQQGFKRVGFLAAYHQGKWMGVDQVAKMVHDNVRADQKIFGPEPTVLTFMSDRDVFGLGMLVAKNHRSGATLERSLRALAPAYAYAIFPDTTDKLYDDKDVLTGKVIKLRMLRPTRVIARAGGYTLCEYEVMPAPTRRGPPGAGRAIGQTTRRRLTEATQPATTQATTQPGRRRRARPATTATTTTAPIMPPGRVIPLPRQ